MEAFKNSNQLEISVSSGLVKRALTPSGADDGTNCAGNEKPSINGIDETTITARRSDSVESESVISEGDTDDRTETNSPTLSYSQKQELFDAVCEGDVDRVEELLDQPGSHLDLTWYRQNLLVAAIRAGQQHMSEFLIDIGVDCNYSTSLFDKTGDQVDCYLINCRQMAYESSMTEIVDLIDYRNGHIHSSSRMKNRKPYTLRLETKKRLEETKDSIGSRQIREKTDDTLDTSSSEITRSDSFRHNTTLDPTLEYVTKYVRAQQSLRSTNHDEGYISTSPKSSTRGSPVSPSNGFHNNVSKHIECFEDSVRPHIFTPCSSYGSYNQESRLWVASRSNRKAHDESNTIDSSPAQVRTQSPWRDDKQLHPRRQRRLPSTPTSVHRPRIMSPPSQSTPRSSRMLLQANIVTLPNKLSFSALPNSMSPRDHTKRTPVVQPTKTRQIPYGKNYKPSLGDALVCNKYDEHFVVNSDGVKKKTSPKTAMCSTKV